jgi:hypothetical protein
VDHGAAAWRSDSRDIDCADVNRKVPRATIAAITEIFRNHGEAGRAFIRRFIDAGLRRDPAVDVDAAVAWAWDGFTDSLGAAALDPEMQAEKNLRQHIAEHRDITIKKTEPGARDPHNNRDAIGWYDRSAVYIPVARIVDAAGGGLSERAIGTMLHRRGLLARHKRGRLTVDYVPKIGYVPCYALKVGDFSPTAAAGSDEVE